LNKIGVLFTSEESSSIMVLTVEDRKDIIRKFQMHAHDVGSPAVQIALLTRRIEYLTEHLKANKKDVHSRRGLVALSNQRKKLLQYVKRTDAEQYQSLLERLSLRH
jgi:small subunit ribosomal protein S15